MIYLKYAKNIAFIAPISIMALFAIGLLSIFFRKESGIIYTMNQVSSIASAPIGEKLISLPTEGKILWAKFYERPIRVRLNGHTDMDKFYKWLYGTERPIGDQGMSSISPPHPQSELGSIGDRFYEFDGFSGKSKYQGRVLLNGDFQIDVF